jgi:hypothetical protein
MRFRRFLPVLACAVGNLLAADGRLLSLRLAPQDPALWGAKASQRFLVLGRYADGLERDVTTQCRFSISDARVAKVDESGRLAALAEGEVALTVVMGSQSAKTNVRISGSEQRRPFSFARNIGGIFTRRGCNESGCHGGVKGQGGFKLSLNGLYARDDYKWVVEGGVYQVLTAESGGPKVPRINLKEPEQSLLLRKATMGVPHGGGQIFQPASADYETIFNWVRSGAPYGEESEKESIRVERIEVFPKEMVLEPAGKHQLLVTAYLSNGRQEDFTDRVRYKSNNLEVVKVTPEGEVEAARTGETSILIRAAGYAVSTGVGVIARPLPKYPNVARNNFIDDHVFAKLRKFNIIPSALSSDAEFLRRVCLDVAGTLPPPERVREFLASKDPRKREKLIQALLSSPEYVDYWTFRFADLFRVARYPNQINTKDSHMYWEWIRAAVESNKPYDQVARERIAAQGFDGPASHFFPYSDVRNPEHKMPEEVRVFLGRRLDCAQCHNHPFETWSQDQFWGLTAFFGRMNGIKYGPHDDNLYGSVLYDDPKGQEVDYGVVGKTGKVVHPRTNLEVQPAFLDGTILPEEERRDLRLKLSEWMTAHPYFAEATVNRMWGYFFGRGIVDPVDDFRSTNPPSHPELLKALAGDFREHGHDLKHLIRTIVSSRTYQLSSEPNESNAEDRMNYSRYVPKQLDAEVLLDAIAQATGVPEELWHTSNQGQPGMLPLGSRAINLVEPDVFRQHFLEIYGKPTRLAVPERKNEGNLGQALHMLVGPTYNERLSKQGSRLDRWLKSGASDREMLEEFYLAGLSRFPTETERAELENFVKQRASRLEAFRSILWGLIASREFATNH